jgi:hypothetical protein
LPCSSFRSAAESTCAIRWRSISPTRPADKRSITLAQLANHRAGFPIGLGGDFEPLSREQFLDAAFKRPLLFAPGEREQYSNTGYALLAAVIEKVTGGTYDEYLRDNILKPLGLANTGFLFPNFDPKRLAHGYRDNQDQGTMMSKPHAVDGPYWNLRGNGGMLSTVDDMHAFYKALFETSTLIKPSSKIGRFNPDEPVGLAGSDLVNFFVYERLPGRRIEIIVASNNAAFGERPVRAAIAEGSRTFAGARRSCGRERSARERASAGSGTRRDAHRLRESGQRGRLGENRGVRHSALSRRAWGHPPPASGQRGCSPCIGISASSRSPEWIRSSQTRWKSPS